MPNNNKRELNTLQSSGYYNTALHILDSTRAFYVDYNGSISESQRISAALQEILKRAQCTLVNNTFKCTTTHDIDGWVVNKMSIKHKEDGLHVYLEHMGKSTIRLHVDNVDTATAYFKKPLVAISRFIAQGFIPIAKYDPVVVKDALITVNIDGSLTSNMDLSIPELFMCLNIKYGLSWRHIANLFGLKHEHTAYTLGHEELTVEEANDLHRFHGYYGTNLPTIFVGANTRFDVDIRKFKYRLAA